MIDVAIAIDEEVAPAWLQIASGAYVPGGKFVASLSAPHEIMAVAQPLTSADLRDMEESIRVEAVKKFYSRTTLPLNSVVTHAGAKYRVIHVWDRQADGGHHRVAAGLLK